MKNYLLKFIPLILLALSSYCPIFAYADERLIEDNLVYDDPTVARPNNWNGGISVDYWSMSTVSKSGGGTFRLSEPGISAYVGYGDFSILGSFRQGSGNDVFNNGTSYNNRQKQQNEEIDLRWLATNFSMRYLTPYLIVGFVRANTSTQVNENNVAVGAGTSINTTPVYGFGGIVPINELLGFRADAKFGNLSTTNGGIWSGSNNQRVSQTTVTAYYNVTENWNAQIGLQSIYLSGQPTQTGYYAKIGYAFR
jgi:hypothetical protein